MTKEEYWKHYTGSELCKDFSNDFYIWWDKYIFDWEWSNWALCEYLPDKFNIWWDPNKFYWDKDFYRYDNTNGFITSDKDSLYLTVYLLNKMSDWYVSIKTDVNAIRKFVLFLEWNYE